MPSAAIKIATVVCADERQAVGTATTRLQGAKTQLTNLQTEYAQASASQKPELLQEINEQEQVVASAQTQLDQAKQALAACLARNHPPVRRPPVVGQDR